MKFNRISLKLLLVCLSFSLPIAVMLTLMVQAKQKDINFATWEMKGNRLQRPLENMLQQVSLHRWYELQRQLGQEEVTAKIAASENAADAALASIQNVMNVEGVDLQFTAEGLGKRSRQEFTIEKLTSKWNDVKTKSSTMSADDSDKLHKDIIAHIKTMITHAGDTSNLILDPDLDSYYLMDVTLLALPQMQDRLQEIAAFAERMKAQGKMSQDDRLQASVFASFLREADLDRVNASSQTSLNEDQNFYGVSASLQKNLAEGMKSDGAAVEPIIAELKKLAAAPNVAKFDFDGFRQSTATAVQAAYSYHATAFDELDILLETRTKSFVADVHQAIIWTSLSLLVSALLAAGITLNLIRRIRSFSETTKRIADGDLKARNNMTSGDEIGELARSFDGMTDKIEKLNAEVALKNDELKGINANLEGMVAERTATIKTILDNVKFGFLLINKDLHVEDGFSRSCAELLGDGVKAGARFLDVIGVAETRNAPMYKEFLAQAFEDFLPEEMTLQQLPSRVQLGEKILSLIASVVRNPDKSVKAILFTIIDSTNLERVEKENLRHKVLVRLLKEIDAFKDFLDESRTRLGLCRKFVGSNEQGKLRAELHTLKGNTAAYDMIELAKLIHVVEDGVKVEAADVDRIEAAFIGFLDQNFDVLQLTWNSDAAESYPVSRGDLEGIIQRVQDSVGTDHVAMQELATWAQTIQYKTARSLIGALPDYGERLASRLGKQCKVRVENGDLRVHPEIMRPIMQSIVHLVRNSIDHGIEPPHLRKGKPEEGSINIACGEDNASWTLTISDDGHGIDTEKVAAKAVANGLVSAEKVAAMSPSEKCKLIFLSGVSTADSVSEISGRGVGMNAVEASVQEAGGLLDVQSTIGAGTKVVIKVPKVRGSQLSNSSAGHSNKKAA